MFNVNIYIYKILGYIMILNIVVFKTISLILMRLLYLYCFDTNLPTYTKFVKFYLNIKRSTGYSTISKNKAEDFKF